MKVLVTGGAGYIGSQTCKLLAQDGITPITIDNLISGKKSSVKWGPLYQGAIQDIELLNRIFSEHKISAVIHFAAHVSVGESVIDPQKYYSNNVDGSKILISQMLKNNIFNLIFSSSCTVYGNAPRSPITEETPLQPINPYGETKKIIEQHIEDLTKSHPLHSIILRYFNAGGADTGGEIGETTTSNIHLIPLALKAATDANFKMKVFGNNYPTPDGTCIRDYVHVEDVARAHILALKMILKKPPGESSVESCNLGSERGYSIFEIIKEVEKIVRKPVKFDLGSRREGDPSRLVADATKAKNLLGWRPEFSDLKTIIASANEWHSRNGF